MSINHARYPTIAAGTVGSALSAALMMTEEENDEDEEEDEDGAAVKAVVAAAAEEGRAPRCLQYQEAVAVVWLVRVADEEEEEKLVNDAWMTAPSRRVAYSR